VPLTFGVLAAAAPAISFVPALTTNIHGSGAAVTFPHGYPVMLAVTIVVFMVLGSVLEGIPAIVLFGLGVLLFPDGALPSPRWRPW